MILDWTTERLVLSEPLRISRATMTAREAVCVRLCDGDAAGFGEVVTSTRQGLDVAGIEARLDALAPWIARFTAGFSRLKIKLGAPDPASDLARVRAVRAAAPEVRLLLDPNGAWSTAVAIEVLTELAGLRIEAVEQPVAPGTPADLSVVAAATGLPVIADEDAATLADVQALPPGISGINTLVRVTRHGRCARW